MLDCKQGSEEYEEEEEDAQQASQYDEDGVLQADMTSFLDLRAVQKASGHAAEAQTAEEAEIHADPAGDGQALAAPVSQYEAATAKAPALSTPGMLPRVLRRAHPRGNPLSLTAGKKVRYGCARYSKTGNRPDVLRDSLTGDTESLLPGGVLQGTAFSRRGQQQQSCLEAQGLHRQPLCPSMQQLDHPALPSHSSPVPHPLQVSRKI